MASINASERLMCMIEQEMLGQLSSSITTMNDLRIIDPPWRFRHHPSSATWHPSGYPDRRLYRLPSLGLSGAHSPESEGPYFPVRGYTRVCPCTRQAPSELVESPRRSLSR